METLPLFTGRRHDLTQSGGLHMPWAERQLREEQTYRQPSLIAKETVTNFMWFDFLSVSWYQVHKYSIKPLDSKEVLWIQNKGTPVDIDPTPGRLGFYQLSLLTHQQNALKWKKKVYRRLENRWGSKSTPGIKWRWNWVQDNRNLWNIMGKLLTDGPSSHIWGCHLRNWWNWRGHIHQKKESTTAIHIACASHQILNKAQYFQ